MSRDIDVRSVLDRSSQNKSNDAGRDLPRGGRSGGGSGARSRIPEDARDALIQQLALPRGEEREQVTGGPQNVSLRGSEVRLLATVGAFRIVDALDLESGLSDRWHGDLEHLRREGLIEVNAHVLNGERTAFLTLTRAGRELLESNRHTESTEGTQHFYSGLAKQREVTHDAQLAGVYAEAAERLHESGARIQRVVLDYELKREYQRFLQEHNREDRRTSGRPDRSQEEIKSWAEAHHLPVVDGHVRFPDVRIEYEHPDGRPDREDLELATGHYSSRQMASKRAAGFKIHRSHSGRLNGGKSRRGGSPFDPDAAAKVVR